MPLCAAKRPNKADKRPLFSANYEKALNLSDDYQRHRPPNNPIITYTTFPANKSTPLILNLRLQRLLIVPRIRVLAPRPNLRPVEVKQERDTTARQRQEREQRTGPLIPETIVHLAGEEHSGGTPE